VIKFDSIVNARDLGDYLLNDGRAIRKGLLLRTALLGEASDEDIRRLEEEYGISKVIDLRVPTEYKQLPDKIIPGAEYVHVELMSVNGRFYKGVFEMSLVEFLKSEGAHMLCDGFYVSFVDDPDCQENFARVFREIIDADGKPVLWHCSQGKDRTGLISAFILSALGADYDTILIDFGLSNLSYSDLVGRLKREVAKAGGGPGALNNVRTLMGVNTRLFIDALDFIDANYGGMQSYLRNQLLLSEEDIRILQDRYIAK